MTRDEMILKRVKEHYDEAVVERKIDKIISYIPYRSSIGKLFDHYEKVKIVECDANLLFQHDVLTWHVETNDFIYVEEESPRGVHTFSGSDDIEFLKRFVDCVTEGIKSGAYTYVAHPDCFYYTGDSKEYTDEIRKICICSR